MIISDREFVKIADIFMNTITLKFSLNEMNRNEVLLCLKIIVLWIISYLKMVSIEAAT